MKFLPKFVEHALRKAQVYMAIYRSHLFDEEWYVNQYPEVKQYEKSPLSHYLKIGYKRGYNPSVAFSSERYSAAYPDSKYTCPLVHYVRTGKKQGRVCYTCADMGVCKPVPTTNHPLISVVVTSYNYANFIGKTLDSILGQTYRNLEVIVVDDGSKDNSIDVIRLYEKRYNNVSLYLHPGGENCGLGASMKLAFSKVKGEYVAFCESDDYWRADNIEKKIDIINKYEDVAIVSNDVQLFGDEKIVYERQSYLDDIKKVVFQGGTPIDVTHLKSMNYVPTLSAVMIRRDVINGLNLDSPIPAWIDFWMYRQILFRHFLYFVDCKLTYWHQHNSYNSPANSVLFAKDSLVFTVLGDSLLGIKSHYKNTREIKRIQRSSFFDEEYYVKQIEPIMGLSSAAHYYYIGWKSGLDPSAKFSTNAYLVSYPDIYASNICPISHYLAYGYKENRIVISVEEAKQLVISQSNLQEVENVKSCRKVLLVSHELSLTGAPRALANMAYVLKDNGFYPVIISNKRGPIEKEIMEHGISCHIDCTIYSSMQQSFDVSPYLYKYLNCFDYIVANTIVSIPVIDKLYGLRAKKFCWIHEGSFSYDCFSHSNKLKDMLSRYDSIFAVGDYCKNITRQMSQTEKPISNLFYYIDHKPETILTKTTPSEKFRMIFAGTIEKRKGHKVLLDALNLLPKYVVKALDIKMVGASADTKLQNMIKRSKYRCLHLLGSVSHDRLIHMMKEMDILLCPSLDDPMPIVCTEAFMLCKPIIVGTETGTATFIRDGQNGFVVESGNARSLANAIERAYNNRGQLPVIGKEGHKIYNNYFTRDKFAERLNGIFV